MFEGVIKQLKDAISVLKTENVKKIDWVLANVPTLPTSHLVNY